MALRDAYGRPLTNLRISVTAECNYRCIFCHVEGHPLGEPARITQLPPAMKPGDYYIVARAARVLGIDSFKITGGEPLVRKDIVEVIASLKEGHPQAWISMTTNGYLLYRLLPRLVEAGLNRVNVSIHSTRREVYKFITRVDGLERALKGLEAAAEYGLKLKVNAVILKGVNDGEVWDLVELARRYGATLQLIELHPVGLGARFFSKYYYSLEAIERELIERGARVTRRRLHNRPIYVLPDGVRVEVVRPYSNPWFCAGCRRVRLHPEGKLSPCLNWRGPLVDLLGRVRGAKSLEEKVRKAVEALVEVNLLRRPFYLWGIGYEPSGRRFSPSGLRLELPKKAGSGVRMLEAWSMKPMGHTSEAQ
ncbi:GTP 3',8-cyclase MoaA [Stetteria hydrogenophila]